MIMDCPYRLIKVLLFANIYADTIKGILSRQTIAIWDKELHSLYI